MPLLALGSGIDGLTGHADGYGAWALTCYCIGTVLMAGLGLLALFFLLRETAAEFGIENETSRAAYALLLSFVVFFGTNIGYYGFSQMAHSSTFLFATLFLLIWRRIRDSGDNRSWLLLGLTGGMLSICRWQDVLQLGIPLLYDLGGGNFTGEFSRKWKSQLFYAAGVGVWWIPQIFQWKPSMANI